MVWPLELLTAWVLHMKKFLLRLALASVAFVPAATAIAADLDLPPPPVEDLRPATYDWSGFYLGAWGGATCIDGTLFDNGTALEWENSGCGWKGGVMGGYNHQFEQWVLGLEADWGMTGDIATNEELGADFAFSMDQIATFRARMGIALDDTLLYATGGVAWAKGDLDGIIAATPDHIKGSHWGWSIGGGIEQALNDYIRLRLEYIYTRFNGDSYVEACCDVDIPDFDDHEFKVGVIWAF
jgi:outer membrane immunogenic protein